MHPYIERDHDRIGDGARTKVEKLVPGPSCNVKDSTKYRGNYLSLVPALVTASVDTPLPSMGCILSPVTGGTPKGILSKLGVSQGCTFLLMKEICSQTCSLRPGTDVSDPYLGVRGVPRGVVSYLGVRGVPRGVVSELVKMYLTLTWELGMFLEV